MMKKAFALLLLTQNTHAFSASTRTVARIASATTSQTRLFNAPKHDVRSGGNVEMDPEELKIQTALAEHQQNAVRSNDLRRPVNDQ